MKLSTSIDIEDEMMLLQSSSNANQVSNICTQKGKIYERIQDQSVQW
jgi:hypothetical protein